MKEGGASMRPVGIIVVGADALLAVRPATAIQLWHACLAAGYDLAVPATWGDELIAAECLRVIGSHAESVTIMCSCPMVAGAVAACPVSVAKNLVSFVAPPVATARYLRRVYGERRVHITYAGACPAAGDSAIDAWLSPAELLERFSANGIELLAQPVLFESVLPPDRRRHLSEPGGLPTAASAAALPRSRLVRQVDEADLVGALERHLASGVRSLVDVAPRVGCACSGASPELATSSARVAVIELEPPRSSRPVMADPGGLALLRRVQARRPSDPVIALGRSAGPPPEEPGDARSEVRHAATSRSTSHSPLSWNLRERAMPQPSTTARATDHAPKRGLSSAAWNSLQGALESAAEGSTRATSGSGTDPRARQPEDGSVPSGGNAISGRASSGSEVASGTAPTGAEVASDSAPRAEVASGSAPAGAKVASGSPSGSPDVSVIPAESPAAAPGSRDPQQPHQTVRSTPPGGYWFVTPERPEGVGDTEVRREPPFVESSPGGEANPVDAGGRAIEARVPDDDPEVVEPPPIAVDSGAVEPPSGDVDAPAVEAAPAGSPDEDPQGGAGASAADEAGADVHADAHADAPQGETRPPSASAGDDDGAEPERGWWLVALGIIMLMALLLIAHARSTRLGDAAQSRSPDTTSPRRQMPPGAGRGECLAGRAFHGICVATPLENRLAVRVFPPSSLRPTTARNLPLRR